MPTAEDRMNTQLQKQDAPWVHRLFSRANYPPEYQDLKYALHRKLLTRVNLEALSLLSEDHMRSEVRTAVARLVSEEETPLNATEKERIVDEVLDEPLEEARVGLLVVAQRAQQGEQAEPALAGHIENVDAAALRPSWLASSNASSSASQERAQQRVLPERELVCLPPSWLPSSLPSWPPSWQEPS